MSWCTLWYQVSQGANPCFNRINITFYSVCLLRLCLRRFTCVVLTSCSLSSLSEEPGSLGAAVHLRHGEPPPPDQG